MESFGRVIALGVGVTGVIFLLFFSKTVVFRWQRHETVRSMSRGFTETLLNEKKLSFGDWQGFQKEIARLGGYRAELTIYERRRYEDDNGGVYLYETEEVTGDRILREGSYVRVVVISEEDRWGEQFLLGDCGVVVAGGRVQ